MKEVDYIVVGQGLAGTLLAFRLFKLGKSFVVIDENRDITSSKIAAGMYTPVSGKRMVKGVYSDEQLALARETYRELEKMLGVKLMHETHVHQVFGSVKEQNDLTVKAEVKAFYQHIDLETSPLAGVIEPYGAFEVNESGWVDTALLVEKFREWLISQDAYLQETVDYGAFMASDKNLLYKDIVGTKLIFCEGWRGINNPFFTATPFNLCKGDVLLIECSGLAQERIIKKGIYIVHQHHDIFKVGSTYRWDDLDEEPDPSGIAELTAKLDGLIDLPYKVISHRAGIRPTTDLREPFFMFHESLKNIMMLNGLGTKGVLLGPWWVKECMKYYLPEE